MFYSLSPLTKNKKLGFMASSISPKSTCPDTCVLKQNNECYAIIGRLRIHWDRLNNKGLTWDEFITGLKKLPQNLGFRHNQAADLPGENLEIDISKLDELIEAVKHLRAFTYTHKPVLDSTRIKGKKVKKSILKKNRAAIQNCNAQGFTVNLSCDSLNEVDEAVELGIAPVVAVLPLDSPEKVMTAKGNKVIVCPNQTRGITCAECMLCHKQRSVVVGFRAHGVSKKKISRRLNEEKALTISTK